jgi:DNA-binding Lrp family transcriptional regulator
MNGFTPVSDHITQEIDMLAALVYGKIWRYNQMKDGVCRASQIRMARELGISDDAVNSRIQKLEAAGYIVDKTPELKNRPHLFLITDRDPLASYTSSGSGYTSSGSKSRSQRDEDSIKKEYKKSSSLTESMLEDATKRAEKEQAIEKQEENEQHQPMSISVAEELITESIAPNQETVRSLESVDNRHSRGLTGWSEEKHKGMRAKLENRLIAEHGIDGARALMARYNPTYEWQSLPQ